MSAIVNSLGKFGSVICGCVCGYAISKMTMADDASNMHKAIAMSGMALAGLVVDRLGKWVWRKIQNNFNAPTGNAQYARYLAVIFRILQEAGLSIPGNSNALNNALNGNAQYVESLVLSLQRLQSLQEAGILILNQESINALIENVQCARYLVIGWRTLQEAGILNQESINALNNALRENAQCAKSFVLSLHFLQNAELLNQESFNALIENVQYAFSLAIGWRVLLSAGILNQESFNALIRNAQHAVEFAECFLILQEAGLSIPENRNALGKNAQYAESFALSLRTLQDAGLLNLDNFKVVLQGKGEHARLLSEFIVNRPEIRLTQEVFDNIMRSAWEPAHSAAVVLGELNAKFGPGDIGRIPLDVIASSIISYLMPDYSEDPGRPPYGFAQAKETASISEQEERIKLLEARARQLGEEAKEG